MTIEVKRIIDVESKAYKDFDLTHFETADGMELYTYAKVYAGQSYDGFIKTDRAGRNLFKKNKATDQTQINTPQPQSQAAVAAPSQFIEATEKFAEAVEKFEIAVDSLNKLLGKNATISPKSGDVVPLDPDDREDPDLSEIPF